MSPSPTSAPDGFICATCGEFHEGLPFDYMAPAPDLWLYAPDDEREDLLLSGDLCWMRVEGQDHYFLRGVVPIPVLDAPRMFTWGVWAAVMPEHFERVIELWEDEAREHEPPFPGWLATVPAIYPDAAGLKLSVQLRGGNLRPTFELTDLEHPIALEQRVGITVARVRQIAEALIHVRQGRGGRNP